MAPLLEPFASLFGPSGAFEQPLSSEASYAGFNPPIDIVETADHLSIYMDAPGLKAENLDIALEDDVLFIRGQRSYPAEYEQARPQARFGGRIERGFGSFERRLRVPQGLDLEMLEAVTADGVLRLRIPKPEQSRPRRITIQGGDGKDQPVIEGTAT